MIGNWLRLIATYLVRAVQRTLFFLPIYRKRVVFYAHGRKGFACNPKYVACELLADYPGQCDLIWAADDPASCDEIRRRGIRVVRYRSLLHRWYHLTARVLVINDLMPASFICRKGQLLVNTWHGAVNYKRIGPEALTFYDSAERRLFILQNPLPNLFLSGSRAFTEDTARAFGVPREVFLPIGLPRNDMLTGDVRLIRERVRRSLGVPGGTRVVLLAPTFRSGGDAPHWGLSIDLLTRTLSVRFGGKWCAWYRNHGFLDRGQIEINGVLDVTSYADMQELLCAADVLISDYSSCMWDFSLLRRPCFVYAPDIRKYEAEDRAFAIPPTEWPYPVAQSEEELMHNIDEFREDLYRQRIEEHRRALGGYDDGGAARRIGAIIAAACIK